MDKIEFYKNRSLSERFSAAAGFIRQNWKVICKVVLIPAIPLAILQGYFQQNYFSASMEITKYALNPTAILADAGLFFLVSIVYALFLYAISGAVMSQYDAGLLSRDTSLKDLKEKIFSNLGKLFLVSLLLVLMFIGVYLVFLLIMVVLGMISKVLMALGIVLMVVAIFAILPPMLLTFFPAVFQGASIGKSVKKGMQLGFKNWGSTFAIFIIVGVALGVISLILMLPYLIWVMLGVFGSGGISGGILPYCLSMLSSLASAFVTPLTFIFFAFHYFSIAEKEEGISLQSKIEEFDTL